MRIISNEQQKKNLEGFYSSEQAKVFSLLKQFNPRLFDKLLSLNLNCLKDIEGSCYLYGGSGNGKTTYLMWKVYEWAKQKKRFGHIYRDFVIITFNDLLHEIKNSFSTKTDIEVISKYRKIPLLAIDDIGTVEVKDWSYTILYMILDYRYSNYYPTMYTSNFSIETLSTMLNDDRLTRRIKDDCKDNILEFKLEK